MAENPVAANLLMFAMLLGGVLGFMDIRQEVTPDFNLESVRINVAYPGASPQEVEQGIVLAIEREVIGMADVKRVVSTANEGQASVSAELLEDAICPPIARLISLSFFPTISATSSIVSASMIDVSCVAS